VANEIFLNSLEREIPMTEKIVIELKHGESAIPRIEAYAERVREECNSNNVEGQYPCKFNFEGVSSFGYEKTGAFKVAYLCRACGVTKVLAIEPQFTDEQNRGG